MTALVVDASVIVKWIFSDRTLKAQPRQALDVLQGIKDGQVTVVQPPHWLAEVAAVVSRVEPRIAREAVGLLYAMDFPVSDGPEVYNRACELAISLNEHVFDTLYHAVALCRPEAALLTADERYYRRAAGVGGVVRLKDFRLG